MSQGMSKEEKRRRAVEKGKLLWKLVTTTAGVTDLAEPMARVERNFAHLSRGQQITILVIAQQFEEGLNAINEASKPQEQGTTEGTGRAAPQAPAIEAEIVPRTTATQAPVQVEPDEVIPAGEGPKD